MAAKWNFLGLPRELSDPASAAYGVLLIPYEYSVTYKHGTAGGPMAILEASQQVELFDEELLGEFHHAGVATYPVIQPAAGPDQQMPRVRAAALEVLRSGKFLLSLGGEHSITAPLVAAAQEVHGPLSVLQIDAHADLRDEYGGLKSSHACVMRRVLEMTDSICQVGIRNFSIEEYQQCRPQVERFITPEIIRTDPNWIERAISQLGKTVYVTIDIDGLDPSIAPGTGTPEPDGLTWRQTVQLLRAICQRRHVVAADIVEVRPLGENHVTEFLAARLAYKIIAYTQLGKPGLLPVSAVPNG